jgi:hypothetical protein
MVLGLDMRFLGGKRKRKMQGQQNKGNPLQNGVRLSPIQSLFELLQATAMIKKESRPKAASLKQTSYKLRDFLWITFVPMSLELDLPSDPHGGGFRRAGCWC